MHRIVDAEHSTQGWVCPACGWGILTTYNPEIDVDATEYSLYIRNISTIDINGIRLIAEIASVNFLTAKRMLEEKEVCVLKAKAPKIKEGIDKLRELNIDFIVKPFFKY
mgnify:CR=1 FL=1